ncbi:MAG TPA: tetratricopeptide repeat protein [Tepidisphaeraceae bacterium]|nr:tetratricopeptide repeat protein [Tepidisphaeraceae bacterium]
MTSRLLSIVAIVLISLPARAADEAKDLDGLLAGAAEAAAAERLDEALKLADRAVSVAPKDARALAIRVRLRQAAKDWAGVVTDADALLAVDPARAQAQFARGVAHFMLGRADRSCADFDAYAKARPDDVPQLWQRGIALYYAGRFEDGARQFEQHRTVNPDDVENSAWHFACVARWKTPADAKKVLIPSRGDDRIPMMKVLDLFAGKATPDDVIATATADKGLDEKALGRRLFYAHLYIGLYHDALGETAKAKEHMAIAAEKYPVPDYMHGVAKAHGLIAARPASAK